MSTPTTVQVKIQLRRDTAATWASVNPVLLAGEAGLETDTSKIKIGNGSTAWNSLGYFPFVVNGGTVTGNLEIGTTGTLTFEGSSADNFETTLGVINPTADRTINLPNVSGTIITTGDSGTVTSTMIADGTIVDADVSATAEIAVSKLADGAARQLLQTDAAGTGVEWTSNIDIPGTLDVTGAATFDAAVTVTGDLTVNGTTTTISTQNLLVEDKNIIIGDVATPTDVTADGGGITLKGATDKTINWVDSTDAWTSSERFSIPLGSASLPSLTFTGDPNTGIYSPGADQVAISTGGSGRLFVDASGNVGVGTSSPGYLLDVAGSARIKTGATGTPFIVSTGGDAQGSLRFGSIGGGGIYGIYGGADYLGLQLWTSGSQALTVDNLQRVGIGTASPAGKCVVRVSNNTGAPVAWNSNFLVVSNGDASTSSGIGFSVDTSDSSASISALTPGTGWLKQYYRANSHTFWYGDAGVTQGMTLDSSGRLLVGTSTGRNIADGAQAGIQYETTNFGGISITNNRGDASGANLAFGKQRSGSIGGNTIVQNGDGLGAILFSGADGTDLETQGARIEAAVDGTPGANDMPGRLVFSTTADGAASPTERMRIGNSGQTSFYANSTGVVSASNTGAGTVIGLFIGRHSATSTTNGTDCFLVYTNGNVVNTNGSYTTISDVKLKENIVDAGSQWDDLKAIQIRNWNFKAETGHETHRQIGPIAQELETVCPGLVFETPDRDEDGNETGEVTKGVNQSVLYMKAVKALQEAMERIETLEAKVAAL